MEFLHFVLPIALIFTAYFVKGFSGFGPALILIPTLSLIYDPPSVILLTTLFDLIAGFLLLYSIRPVVNWKLVFTVLLAFFPGAFIGARLMTFLPIFLLKKIMAVLVLFFISLIFFNSHKANYNSKAEPRTLLQSLAAFFAGFSGGLVGISGPLLVIYFKLTSAKSYFRAQLIAIFVFGAAWRLFLYRSLGTELHISPTYIIIYFITMLIALGAGSYLHVKVNEQKFDRIVALILLIPCITLGISQ